MINLPHDWMRDRLKDLCIVNGASLPAGTDPDFEFPYLEISNVDYFGIVDRNAIEGLRFEDAPSRARRIVAQNSTIISSVRPNLQAVAFFPDDTSGLICSTGFNVVQPDEHRLVPRYAYYVLISDYARQYFEAVATGVGYPAVADKDFGALIFPVPHRPEQERIATYLDGICAQVDAVASLQKADDKVPRGKGVLNQQMETLIAYRKALIFECVTGQRRVTEEDLRRP
ncbi:MAG: restriction endonuclease subunit S [Candidatus Omnitrophota bacterium]|nr:restriction endonuclease subunit S [Candidatus Omnitrophota bacterium]